jgi:hypothetical protein
MRRNTRAGTIGPREQVCREEIEGRQHPQQPIHESEKTFQVLNLRSDRGFTNSNERASA